MFVLQRKNVIVADEAGALLCLEQSSEAKYKSDLLDKLINCCHCPLTDVKCHQYNNTIQYHHQWSVSADILNQNQNTKPKYCRV